MNETIFVTEWCRLMNAPNLVNSLMDRLILPGALGFTRFGYAWRRRCWGADDFPMEGRTVVVTGATSGKWGTSVNCTISRRSGAIPRVW